MLVEELVEAVGVFTLAGRIGLNDVGVQIGDRHDSAVGLWRLVLQFRDLYFCFCILQIDASAGCMG